MGKIRNLLKRVRFVYRRSSTLTKTMVTAAIVVSMLALLTMSLATEAALKRYEEYRQQAAQLERENKEQADKNDKLGTIEGAEDAAKDEGYVSPDSVIIVPDTTTPDE